MASNEQFCGPCQRDSPPADESAITFCADCREYLCESCQRVHMKLKTTRTHVLNELPSMPSTYVTELLRKLTACSIHEDTAALYLCKNHDSLCCTECFFVEHRKCELIDKLANLATQERNTPENECLHVDIDSMLDKYEQHAATLLEHESNHKRLIEDTETTVRSTLINVKDVFEQAYNKLEKHMWADFESKKQTVLQRVTSQTCEVERFMNEVIDIRRVMSIVRDYGSPIHTYILLRNVSRYDTKRLNKTMKTLHNSVTNVQLNISKVGDIENALGCIGKYFKVTREETTVVLNDCPYICKSDFVTTVDDLDKQSDDVEESFIERTPVLVGSVNVEYDNCCIGAASCSWGNENIVVSTMSPSKLHLLDEKANTILHSYQCHSEPWSIRHVENNTFVVCLPQTSSILRIEIVNGKFTNPRSIKVKAKLLDVAIMKDADKMIGLCREQGSLYVLDTQGRKLSVVPLHNNAVPFIKTAYKICLGKKQATIVVACSMKDGVIAVNMNGDLRFAYSDKGIRYPGGLDVDSEDNIYVCSAGENTLHQLSSRGDNHRILLQGELESSEDVSFNHALDKFVVVADQSLRIYSFG